MGDHHGNDYSFRAEYAKSGRAGCKSCKSPIAKDSLRLAVMVQSPFFDGKQPNWFHFHCFWSRGKPTFPTDIHGFDGLRWEDQQRITERLPGGRTPTPGSKKGAKASTSAAAAAKVEEDDPHSQFATEYAKSRICKCRGCEDTLDKGECRIGVKDFTSHRALMYGPQKLWYHLVCFRDKRDDCGFDKSMNPDKIEGFDDLAVEDQKDIIGLLGKGDKTQKRKLSNADTVDGKKAKVVEDDGEAEKLKDQSALIWKYKDALELQVSAKAMKGLLSFNNQGVIHSEPKLRDRLSDVMAFGALSPCPECSNGQLVYSTNNYYCTGNISEWTKCTYSTRTPKRTVFKVPPEYHDVDFLKKYKFVKRDRIFPKATIAASTAPAEPLRGCKFYVQGTKTGKTKAQHKQVLTSLGATMETILSASTTAVISTAEDVAKMGKKMQEAQSMDIPVLSVGFIDAANSANPSEVWESYKLSSWGKDLSKLFTDVVDTPGRGGPAKSATVRAAEARAAAQWLNQETGKQKMLVKGGAAVDPESELADVAHLLQEKGKPLNAVLSLVDIQSGSNSYYKLQVLEHDRQKRYWLFRSWGRIGTTIGGAKVESCGSKNDAIHEFKVLFLEKTGNDWDTKEFVKKPNKHYPLDIDYGQDAEENKLKALELEAGKTSKLDAEVQDIVKMIFDIESMKKAMLEFEIDMKKMPLGKISKKNITEAYKVLQKCQKFVEDKASHAHMLDMSNRFFHFIPHDFGMKKPPILDSLELIKSKIDMLESLQEIECAYSLLRSSSGEGEDPLDAHYKSLKTELKPLDSDTEEFRNLATYVENTHASTHAYYKLKLEQVLTVKRQGEKARYKPFKQLPNRQLLWHGSRTTNYAGILSQGLRIAPPEAPVTGYMFGKGIYFADMVSKSANYCYTNRSNPTGLLLLCEVALGNMHELGAAQNVVKPPKGKQSVKGCGKTEPDPTQSVTTADGVKIPYGKATPCTPRMPTTLLYNEYIVYDVAQVNVKYLLKCNFDYS